MTPARFFTTVSLGLCAVAMAGPAFAQAGRAGAAPGTVDATKAPDARRDRELRDQAVANNVDREDAKKGQKEQPDVAVAAQPADVVAGKIVSDIQGVEIGTIESVAADGAVILSGASRAKIPLEGFGKNSRGLLLGLTKAEYEQKVSAAAAPAPAAN